MSGDLGSFARLRLSLARAAVFRHELADGDHDDEMFDQLDLSLRDAIDDAIDALTELELDSVPSSATAVAAFLDGEADDGA